MRGSSVHFERISSAIHAVSHASREVPPKYLLPEGMSQGSHVVIDDNGQVQKMLEHKMHIASRQAKATDGYSPLWEGVINLPEPSKNITANEQIAIVKQWCKEYEAMTGHKVLRADVHLDEGYIDEAGKPQYNAHAHVMCDRTDDKGKVKKLTSTVLREVQNMTANVTTLQRGLPAQTTGRKHINHHNFKFDAEKKRLDLDKEKSRSAYFLDSSNARGKATSLKLKEATVEADKVPQLEAQISIQATEIARLNEQYRLARQALKESGEAKQKDYQALKKAHESALAEISKLTKTVETMTQKNEELQAQLDAKTEADRVRFAQMGGAYDEHKAEGKDPALFVPGTSPEAQHHDRMAGDLLSKATKIREQVATGEKSDTLLVSAVGYELAASKIAKIAQEATEAQTHPTPLPEAQKPLEPVFPRLTEPEFEELAGKVKLPERVQAAARDVLVGGLLVAAAALIQKIMPGMVLRAIEKLLGNYIAPTPAPAPEPVKAPAPDRPRGGGVSR